MLIDYGDKVDKKLICVECTHGPICMHMEQACNLHSIMEDALHNNANANGMFTFEFHCRFFDRPLELPRFYKDQPN